MRAHRIGLYAPAGYVVDPASIERAAARLEAMGHRVAVDPSCTARFQRFAGTDDDRRAAVGRMAAAPDVDLVMAARGGYGWSRLLDALDFRALAAAGKRWVGHSDFTAFQLAALTHAGMKTFAGPMAAYDFGGDEVSAFTIDNCFALLDAGHHDVSCTLDGPDLDVEGTLWGGNLALVAHLAGTRHFPRVDGGILFLEETNEHPYQIERMLYQLHFAGVLARQKAVLFGVCNNYELASNDNGYDEAAMVAQARAHFGVPILTGLPFGHCRDKLTLPVGGHCALRVRDGAAHIELTDYPR